MIDHKKMEDLQEIKIHAPQEEQQEHEERLPEQNRQELLKEQDPAERMRAFQLEKTPKLAELNQYMEQRKVKQWAQNYDEYAGLVDKLNAKFTKAYAMDGLEQSEWEKLESEAQAIQQNVSEKDEKQKENIGEYPTVNVYSINDALDELLADNKWNDSWRYSKVIWAARKLRNEVDLEKREKLVKKLRTQIDKYTKARYKKNGYRHDKGKIRMERMDKLLVRITEFEEVDKLRQTVKANSRALSNATKQAKKVVPEERIEQMRANWGLNDKARVYQYLDGVKLDRNGNIEEDYRQTHQENMELLEMMSGTDYETKLATLSRVYLKLKKPDRINEDTLSEENVITLAGYFASQRSSIATYQVLADMTAKMSHEFPEQAEHDERLKYLIARSDAVSFVCAAGSFFSQSLGFNQNGDSIIQSEKKKVADVQKKIANMKIINRPYFDSIATDHLQNIPDKDPLIEQKLQDTVTAWKQKHAAQA